MKKWMLLLLAGLGVALAGFYFAGGLFVGLLGSGDAGVDLTVGLLAFLCFLVTVCTGLILLKLDALKKQLGQRDPVGDASDRGQLLAPVRSVPHRISLAGAKSWPGRNERRFHSNIPKPLPGSKEPRQGLFGCMGPRRGHLRRPKLSIQSNGKYASPSEAGSV